MNKRIVTYLHLGDYNALYISGKLQWTGYKLSADTFIKLWLDYGPPAAIDYRKYLVPYPRGQAAKPYPDSLADLPYKEWTRI